MKIRNKTTGEIREVPDDFDLSTLNAAPAPQLRTPASDGSYEGFDRLMGGINKVSGTVASPVIQALAKMGVPVAAKLKSNLDADEKSFAGSTPYQQGATAADVAMLGIPSPLQEMKATSMLAKLGKLTGIAAQGAAQHQAQNFGQTGTVSPGAAALETGATAATMGVADKVAPFLKKLGIGSVSRGLGVPAKLRGGANPIDLEDALVSRKIPFFGGAKKIADERAAAITAGDMARGDLLDKEGININYKDVADNTKNRLLQMEKDSKINAGTYDAAAPAELQSLANAKNAASPGPADALNIPGRRAVDLRQLEDKGAMYDRQAHAFPPPKAEYHRANRQEIENALDLAMASKESAPEYAKIRDQIRKDVPLQKAADNYAKKNHYVGLGIDAIIGTEGVARALMHGDPMQAIPEASAVLVRNLISRPGGGRILYEAGRAADNTAVKRGGRAALDLARSATFSPKDSE